MVQTGCSQDSGIDTGQIIDQATIYTTHRDSFVTYPYLQLATGLPLLEKAIFKVVPGMVKKQTFQLDENNTFVAVESEKK